MVIPAFLRRLPIFDLIVPNVANVVKATVKALNSMQDINELNKERK